MSKVGGDDSCAAVQSADARGEVDWSVDGSGYREVFVGGDGGEFGLVEIAVVPGVVLLAASEVTRRRVRRTKHFVMMVARYLCDRTAYRIGLKREEKEWMIKLEIGIPCDRRYLIYSLPVAIMSEVEPHRWYRDAA